MWVRVGRCRHRRPWDCAPGRTGRPPRTAAAAAAAAQLQPRSRAHVPLLALRTWLLAIVQRDTQRASHAPVYEKGNAPAPERRNVKPSAASVGAIAPGCLVSFWRDVLQTLQCSGAMPHLQQRAVLLGAECHCELIRPHVVRGVEAAPRFLLPLLRILQPVHIWCALRAITQAMRELWVWPDKECAADLHSWHVALPNPLQRQAPAVTLLPGTFLMQRTLQPATAL